MADNNDYYTFIEKIEEGATPGYEDYFNMVSEYISNVLLLTNCCILVRKAPVGTLYVL